MQRHSEQTQKYMRSRRGAYMAKVYDEVGERGPLTAAELSNPGQRSGSWWGWWGSGNGKATLEHLYDAGLLAIAGRRGFKRTYDLAARVIPRAALDAPAPPPEVAMKHLICVGAQACGVGTFVDITGYFYIDGWRDRLAPGPMWELPKSPARRRATPIAKRLVAELVEEKRLNPVRVDGWKEAAYLHPDARVPNTVDARGLVTAFDSLVWERSRIERLFGMKYTIEMYVPPHKRIYGYYVCPFLLSDKLVARCDLKADRARRVLVVQGAFLEPRQVARRVIADLTAELRQMQAWLELDRIEVGQRGDLAPLLRRAVSTSTRRRASTL